MAFAYNINVEYINTDGTGRIPEAGDSGSWSALAGETVQFHVETDTSGYALTITGVTSGDTINSELVDRDNNIEQFTMPSENVKITLEAINFVSEVIGGEEIVEGVEDGILDDGGDNNGLVNPELGDSTDGPVVNFTEAQVQKLVTSIFNSVNVRIAERIVQSLTAGDTKHVASADAVKAAVDAAKAAATAAADKASELADAVSTLDDKVGDGTEAAKTYTDEQIDELRTAVMGMNHWEIVPVTGALPEELAEKTIYLQRDSEEDTTWEMNILTSQGVANIGRTEIDLTNYWEKDNVEGIVNALFGSELFGTKMGELLSASLNSYTEGTLDLRYWKKDEISELVTAIMAPTAGPETDKFLEAYNVTPPAEGETVSVEITTDSGAVTINCNADTTISDVAATVNMAIKAFGGSATYDEEYRRVLVTDKDGNESKVTFTVGGNEITPIGGTSPLVKELNSYFWSKAEGNFYQKDSREDALAIIAALGDKTGNGMLTGGNYELIGSSYQNQSPILALAELLINMGFATSKDTDSVRRLMTRISDFPVHKALINALRATINDRYNIGTNTTSKGLDDLYVQIENLKILLGIEGDLTVDTVEQAILTIVQKNEVETVPITDEKINSIVAAAFADTTPNLDPQ